MTLNYLGKNQFAWFFSSHTLLPKERAVGWSFWVFDVAIRVSFLRLAMGITT